MKAYTLKEFIKLLDQCDMVYGTISLNAAVRVPVRIRKKTLMKHLNTVDHNTWENELSIFAEVTTSPKGNKILKLV